MRQYIPYLKILILVCFALLKYIPSSAQQPVTVPGFYDDLKKSHPDTSSKLFVTAVKINGNRRTKSYIILREMQFHAGDSLNIYNLAGSMELARRQVFNINLFSEVSVNPVVLSANDIEVEVTVREKWYLYPSPQFQLADRNFDEWRKTYHADMNRVVYGVKFDHFNFTGRSDRLRIYLLNGYSRNYSFSYNTPYSNAKLSEGFRISAGYTQTRGLPYATSYENRLKQYIKDDFVRNSFFVSLSYQRRSGFYKRHLYSVGYNYQELDDSIISVKYNPHYFNSGNSTRGIPEVSYTFQYANYDNVNYPLEGQSYGFSILKRGVGFTGGTNMLYFDGAFVKYFSHFNKRLNSSIQLYGKMKLPFDQPYYNQRALGYGELYLRGQEVYVVDGVATVIGKFTLKKKLLSFKIPVPFHIRVLPYIPFTFFAKTYADIGYSYIKKQFDSRFNNRLLYTGGFGIDLLTVYGVNLNIEYSFNQLGENGLFLHSKGGF